MVAEKVWLKPLMIVLAIFIIVLLLMTLPDVFPDVSWGEINPTVISMLPWFVVLGFLIVILVYVYTGGRE